MDGIEIVVPVAATRQQRDHLATRPAALAGKRVGWLNNLKANAGALLDGVRTQLEPGAVISQLQEKEATSAAPDAVMAHLKTCDAVVLAIAD